ncbi:MAG: TlyA family RNA methyltransferase [Deltaproteobacteria bacterium]|nr:TlyA family RNA methyltransferase [Deltaproteobacteria bacterium]
MKRKRLDLVVVEKGMAVSRSRASAMILAGSIRVNGMPAEKPGMQVDANADVALRGTDLPYVSRGGSKLAHALSTFAISVSGLACLDVGASTGGFTDCLLQNGAVSVHAVDVGYGQLAWKLRKDPRVTVIERTNIRYAKKEDFPFFFDLAVIDASFISLKLIVPVTGKLVRPGGLIIALIKPQFEVGRNQVGKGGVVKDPALHIRVIDELCDFFTNIGFVCGPVTPSPLLGPKGNREFLVLIQNHS